MREFLNCEAGSVVVPEENVIRFLKAAEDCGLDIESVWVETPGLVEFEISACERHGVNKETLALCADGNICSWEQVFYDSNNEPGRYNESTIAVRNGKWESITPTYVFETVDCSAIPVESEVSPISGEYVENILDVLQSDDPIDKYVANALLEGEWPANGWLESFNNLRKLVLEHNGKRWK